MTAAREPQTQAIASVAAIATTVTLAIGTFAAASQIWHGKFRGPVKSVRSGIFVQTAHFSDCFTSRRRFSDAFMRSRCHFSTTANCAGRSGPRAADIPLPQ